MTPERLNAEGAIALSGLITGLLVMQGAALNEGDERSAMSFALTTALVTTVVLGSQTSGTSEEQLAFAQQRLAELWGPVTELVNEAAEQ